MGCVKIDHDNGVIDMNSASGTPPKSRNSRFIPFFLIEAVAGAIVYAIRNFKGIGIKT